MKNKKDNLKKVIKKLDGSVLAIGLDEKYTKDFEKNSSINKFLLFNSSTKEQTGKEKLKTMSYKKLRKKYLSKKNDYILVDYNAIANFKIKFMRDAVRYTRKTIYFINVPDLYLNKFKRYNVEVEDNKIELKGKRQKTLKYYWKDKLEVIADYVADFLIS